MQLFHKILSIAACAAISFSAFVGTVGTLETNAATFSQINASNVFVKQNTNYTCTLASNVMLLRRTAMMRGDSDWASITESACRSTLWYEGVGQYHYYNYKDINVSYAYISSSPADELKAALARHPEGIAVYDYDYPHAILLTDYTDGVFYCADPANSTPSGRMPVSNALINISGVDTYWYVTSPSVSVSSSNINSGSSGGETTIKTVSSTNYTITATSGVNMRSGAGTSYSIVSGIPYNKTVAVTKTASAGGATWGYTTYGSVSGWFCLDYAKKTSSNGSSSALSNDSEIDTEWITINYPITLTGKASGGTGEYQYAYFIKRPGESDWAGLKDFSSTSQYSITLVNKGNYEFCVKVKDSSNKIEKKYFSVAVSVDPLQAYANVNTEDLTLGKSLVVKASATGGYHGYEYAIYYKNPKYDNWITLQDYASATKQTFTPVYTGTYEICVKTRDKKGNYAKDYTYVNVEKSSLQNTSSLSSQKIRLGETVSINASAEDGKPGYTYAVYYMNPKSDTWHCLQNYNSNSQLSLKPVYKGTYQICVKVSDSEGIKVNQYMNLEVQ